MALTIDYSCSKCGTKSTNHRMSSMVCACGGDFRPYDSRFMQAPVFDAYYDPTVDKYLTSYKQQERIGRKFVTKNHPKGLHLVQENSKFMREMRYIRKHREDYIKEQYAKEKGRVTDPNHGKRFGTKFFV